MVGAIALTGGCMPSFELVETESDRRDCLDRDAGIDMTWYSPVLDGDNRALEDWCANVGPPVLHATPSATFEAVQSDSLDLLVWNVEAGDGLVREFLRENTGIDCAGPASAMPSSASHFVLLVQEALRRSNEIPEDVVGGAVLPRIGGNLDPGTLLDIVQSARQCGLSIFYLPGSRNGPDQYAGLREDKGNAILSTLPLSDLAGIELPLESIRRVVPVATVSLPDGHRLRVSSVHFITTPPPWRVIMTANTARERQSLGLIDGLMKVESVYGELPTVAAGDLNTLSHRETSFRKLKRYFTDSPEPLGQPTRGPVQADHILFRRSAFPDHRADQIVPGSYKRIDELYNSDHYPVKAKFQFGS